MKIYKIPLYLKDMITGKRKLRLSFDYEKENIDNLYEGSLLNRDIKVDSFENKKVYKHLVAIDGIAGFAGSSALGDFLGEFSNCTSLGGVCYKENPYRDIKDSFEFDFFRDAHGVYELEKICDFNDDRIIGGAIKDFICLVERNRNSGIYFYDDYYLYATQEFLNKIIDFKVEWEPMPMYFPKKIKKTEYRQYACEYMKKLFNRIPSNDFLILDNLASITVPEPEILENYFGIYKIVSSVRDPRDLFVNARLIPGNDWVPKDPYLFVKWYKWYYDKYKSVKNDNVLLIRFEDFVFDYDRISRKIINFLGLEEVDHINKFKYFNPEISCKNVGLYKDYEDKNAIKIIEDQLFDLLWSE